MRELRRLDSVAAVGTESCHLKTSSACVVAVEIHVGDVIHEVADDRVARSSTLHRCGRDARGAQERRRSLG
jgi:hypothetical protein